MRNKRLEKDDNIECVDKEKEPERVAEQGTAGPASGGGRSSAELHNWHLAHGPVVAVNGIN